jgi:hypothetical protein
MPLKTKKVVLSDRPGLNEISSFPPQLELLVIPLLPISMASVLPPTLTRLNVVGQHVCLQRDVVELLPRKLEGLVVSTRIGAPTDSLESLKQLPPHLTSLTMVSRIDASLIDLGSSDSSQWLPRGLRFLELARLSHLTPDWLYSLPATLVTLSLSCFTLSSSKLHSLVNLFALHFLTINVSKTPEDKWQHCLLHLSPNLKRLTFKDSSMGAQTDLTNDSLLSMPASIVSIHIPRSPMMDKPSYIHLPGLTNFFFDSYYTPTWFVPFGK